MAFKIPGILKNNKTSRPASVKHHYDTVTTKLPEREPIEEKNEPVAAPVDLEEIRHMINREIAAASAKNQMLNYLDEIAAGTDRAETILKELGETVERGREESLNESRRLEGSLHKDSLILYKNIHDYIEENQRAATEQAERNRVENEKLIRKMHTMMGWMMFIGIISVATIVLVLLKVMGII